MTDVPTIVVDLWQSDNRRGRESCGSAFNATLHADQKTTLRLPIVSQREVESVESEVTRFAAGISSTTPQLPFKGEMCIRAEGCSTIRGELKANLHFANREDVVTRRAALSYKLVGQVLIFRRVECHLTIAEQQRTASDAKQ